MKKVFLSLSLILALSLMSFTSIDEVSSKSENQTNTEIPAEGITVQSNVVWEDFDTCTVTVTVTINGRSATSTATNNKGNCTAAADAAEFDARMKLFFSGVQ
tara:strand:- start:218 stop:523 length:306 start_codon:yes stop_codon:yes gene_type:complete